MYVALACVYRKAVSMTRTMTFNFNGLTLPLQYYT
uniref:Uncharacterized protein n=1 Tax=Rhizophora mucronata TaxID=61149 RepID=A0A2P2R565_RHIMU